MNFSPFEKLVLRALHIIIVSPYGRGDFNSPEYRVFTKSKDDAVRQWEADAEVENPIFSK